MKFEQNISDLRRPHSTAKILNRIKKFCCYPRHLSNEIRYVLIPQQTTVEKASDLHGLCDTTKIQNLLFAFLENLKTTKYLVQIKLLVRKLSKEKIWETKFWS